MDFKGVPNAEAVPEHAATTNRAQRRAMERAEKKSRKKEGRENAANRTSSHLSKSMENIFMIMERHNLQDRGSFLSDCTKVKGDAIDVLNEAMVHACAWKSGEDVIDSSDKLYNKMQSAVKPMQLLADHTKNSVPMDDFSSWSTTKLCGFLMEHNLDPQPLPSKKILTLLANEMRNFALSCVRVIETMQDGDKVAALGAKFLANLTPDQKLSERMNAPVERDRVLAQPQIPWQFRLDTLEEWGPEFPKIEKSFWALRREWCLRQKIPPNISILHHEILRTFEMISRAYDDMVANPGKDILSTIQIFKGTTSEQVLSIRSLKAWVMDHHTVLGKQFARPVIAVEWLLSKKMDGIGNMHKLMAGMGQGTLCQSINPENLEEFEAMVELLRENRAAMDVRNKIRSLEKDATDKFWKFSVICAADPDQMGYVSYCPVCNERANHTCSRCGIISYCGKECQRSHWKVHKKSCGPKETMKVS